MTTEEQISPPQRDQMSWYAMYRRKHPQNLPSKQPARALSQMATELLPRHVCTTCGDASPLVPIYSAGGRPSACSEGQASASPGQLWLSVLDPAEDSWLSPVSHCTVRNDHQTIAPEGPGTLCLPRTTVRTPRFNVYAGGCTRRESVPCEVRLRDIPDRAPPLPGLCDVVGSAGPDWS